MKYREIREQAYAANMLLPKYNLVTFTWGNVSAVDWTERVFAIKPSGVPYEELTPAQMVIVSIDTGERVDGELNPSSDTPTHAELCRAWGDVGGIVHTHSTYATSWAQAGLDIPCYGTTHADYIYGSVPCVRTLTKAEMDEGYERNTGRLIVSEFARRGLKSTEVPAVLCKNHGPFAWGKDADTAVHNAVVLETVAQMALYTRQINPEALPAPQELQDKHYSRKHGPDAYYGQKPSSAY